MKTLKSYEVLTKEIRSLEQELAKVIAYKRIFERGWQSDAFGMVLIDDKGCIIDINENAKCLLFDTDYDCSGGVVQDLVLPGEREVMQRVIHDVATCQSVYVEPLQFNLQAIPKKTIQVIFEHASEINNQNAALLMVKDVSELERYHKELKKNEFFLNEARKIINFGYYVLEISNGDWTNSHGLDEIFGLPSGFKKDLSGWLEVLHPDDRLMMQNYFFNDILKEYRLFNKEYRIVRLSDGQIRWMHGKGKLTFDSAGKPELMIGTIQDITDELLLHDELNKSKRLYKDLVENSQDLIFQMDGDGRFVFVNQQWVKTLGYNINEIIGRKYTEFMPKEQAVKDVVTFSALLKRGEIFGHEVIFQRVDGALVHLKVNATTYLDDQDTELRIRGTAYDVSWKRTIEDLARQKTEELDNFFSLTLDMLSITDNNGVFTRLNPEWERVLGYSLEEMLGCKFIDFVHPDDVFSTSAEHKKLLEGEFVVSFINRYRCKNGSYKYIEWRSAPFGDSFFGAARDVTSHIEMENSLRQLNAELQEINSQKDRFLYIIAHDLRNPLGNLIGILELLGSQFNVNTNEENYYLVSILNSNAHALFELIENLLNWALSQTGKMKYIPTVLPVKTSVEKAISQVKPLAANKNIAITSLVDGTAYVWADDIMLNTVLRNLISNAIKFSYPNSEIVVTYQTQDAHAIISVKDNGVGIRKEVVDGLFFVDSTSSTQGTAGEAGTGFGLPLCYQLTKMQNGQIWVESEVGQGSTFFIKLPLNAKSL